MKFRLNGQIKMWVEGLEIEGNDIDDALDKFLSDPQELVSLMNDSDDLYIGGLDTIDDPELDTYEKEIDVEVYDIEWNIDKESPEIKQAVSGLPETFRLEGVSVDNFAKTNWNGYYEHLPITRDSEDKCIKDALIEYIGYNYSIHLVSSNIKSFEKEITNEE